MLIGKPYAFVNSAYFSLETQLIPLFHLFVLPLQVLLE